MSLSFYVSGIMEQMGTRFGINTGCDGLEADLCYGVMVNSRAVFSQFLTKHAAPYNYIMLDDIIEGAPIIRLIRRAVNDDLEIDATVNQSDCIVSDPQNEPAIKYNRTDPSSLPAQVELQYISWDRDFAINTQYARNNGARVQQNIYSASVDFILDDATARDIAYDLLWRMWMQQLSISFTHPDLTIEPSDIVEMNTDQGTFTIQVLTSMITKEPMGQNAIGRVNQLSGQMLLTKKGTTVSPGSAQASSAKGAFHLFLNPTLSFVGST